MLICPERGTAGRYGRRMAVPKNVDSAARRGSRSGSAVPDGHAEKGSPGLPSTTDSQSAQASWARSSWDLLSGLDVLESEPGTLFDEFFDSGSGAARDVPEPADLSKDQWMRTFAIHLAELDSGLEPTEVIRIAKMLWRKKRHSDPVLVARDVHSTGWMHRSAPDRERPRSSAAEDPEHS